MNIYIRSQELDLFKYLDDKQTQAMLKLCKSLDVPVREYVVQCGVVLDCFVILEQGELEILDAKGKKIGSIYPGEIAGETCFIEPSPPLFSLRSLRDSSVLMIDFNEVKTSMDADAELAARIQAAINDSLCLKIIRITHDGDNHA